MAPGRSSTGWPRVQSTMVDSMPTAQGPPSRISRAGPNSSCTWAAVVGLTRPNRLALGTARPGMGGARPAQAANTPSATGWAGQRRPIESCPPAAAPATPARRGKIRVSGPGQKACIKAWAKAGISLAKCAAAAASSTCTISGCSAGRPLAEKIRATAAGFWASAASPYTVSVGRPSSPPARRVSAAAAIDSACGPARITAPASQPAAQSRASGKPTGPWP